MTHISHITTWLSVPVRLALLSFLFNMAIEASGVFLPLYARSVGASNLEVGFIVATYGIAFFFSSIFFGRQSDMRGRLSFIRLGLGLSAVAYMSQIIAGTPLWLLVSRGFIGFCLGITSAAVMAYTYENQKAIGSFASYGSLGWFAGALAAAALREYEALFLTSAVASALAFLISLTLAEGTVRRTQVALFPLPTIRANRSIYLSFFLRHLGASAIWSIFPLYLASLGASRLWIAILDGINMGGQFIAMRFVERFDPSRVFRVGLLTSVVVFAIYGVANNYLQVIPLQILLSISWSCLLVGALGYLLGKNLERGTVSGHLYSTIYLSSGLGPFMGGAASQAWGFAPVMYLGSALALLGFAFSREQAGLSGEPEQATDSLPTHVTHQD